MDHGETKVCKGCGIETPLNKFQPRLRKDGSTYYFPRCYSCNYQRQLELHPDYHKKQYQRELERDPDYNKKVNQRRLELHPDYHKKNYKRRLERDPVAFRKIQKKHVSKLADSYIRRLIRKYLHYHGFIKSTEEIPSSMITDEMIQARRLQVIIKRDINKLKQNKDD
jgi:hypothetical protein